MSGPKLAAKSVSKPKPASKRARKSRAQLDTERAAARDRMKRLYDGMTPAEKALRRFRQQARPPIPSASAARKTIARDRAVAEAYCDWSNVEEVVRMYVAAAVMTELTGVTFVVDHEVPVAHPLVCGLHTHTNLRVITHALNRVKGNWLWPDMWPHDETTIELVEQLAEQQDRLEAANDEEHPRAAAA